MAPNLSTLRELFFAHEIQYFCSQIRVVWYRYDKLLYTDFYSEKIRLWSKDAMGQEFPRIVKFTTTFQFAFEFYDNRLRKIYR